MDECATGVRRSPLGPRPPTGAVDPTWLKLVRTSAGVLMRAVGIGSAAVRAWLSALVIKIR